MRGICRRCLVRTEGHSCLGVDIGDECLRAEGPLYADGAVDKRSTPPTLTEALRQKLLDDYGWEPNSEDAEAVEPQLVLIKDVIKEWLTIVGLPDWAGVSLGTPAHFTKDLRQFLITLVNES